MNLQIAPGFAIIFFFVHSYENGLRLF
jgi:hypothetical protein